MTCLGLLAQVCTVSIGFQVEGTALSPELPDTPGKGRKPCNPRPYSKWRPQHNSTTVLHFGKSTVQQNCFKLFLLLQRLLQNLHFCYTSATLLYFILFHILKLAPNKGLSSDHTALQRRRHLGGSGISADPMALIIGLIWLDDEHVPPNTKQKNVGVLGSKVEKMSCVFSQSGPAKMFRLHWFTAFLFLANHIGGKLGK